MSHTDQKYTHLIRLIRMNKSKNSVPKGRCIDFRGNYIPRLEEQWRFARSHWVLSTWAKTNFQHQCKIRSRPSLGQRLYSYETTTSNDGILLPIWLKGQTLHPAFLYSFHRVPIARWCTCVGVGYCASVGQKIQLACVGTDLLAFVVLGQKQKDLLGRCGGWKLLVANSDDLQVAVKSSLWRREDRLRRRAQTHCPVRQRERESHKERKRERERERERLR